MGFLATAGKDTVVSSRGTHRLLTAPSVAVNEPELSYYCKLVFLGFVLCAAWCGGLVPATCWRVTEMQALAWVVPVPGPLADAVWPCSAEPPRWTKRPQSGVYSTGSSGILLCEAEGEPEPTIQWRVNGAPIESKWPEADQVDTCLWGRAGVGLEEARLVGHTQLQPLKAHLSF